MTSAAEPDERNAVAAYAGHISGCEVERVTAVDRFRDGNRHAVYKVAYRASNGRHAQLVVRVSLDGIAAEVTQAHREARVLEHLGGAGAPRLHDFRSTSPWFSAPVMGMEFLPGARRDLGSCTAPQIASLGSLLGSLHRRPTDGLADALGAAADIAAYAAGRWHSILAGLAWVRDPLPADVQARLNDVAARMRTQWETARHAACFQTEEPLVLLHGDVGPGNVLWSPDPALIDWEYTRLGDPADEIAYLFDQNGLTAAQRKAFWSGYPPADVELGHRVDWWERVTLLGSSLWWSERVIRRARSETLAVPDPAVPRQHDYYLEQLNQRVERLHGLLE